MSLVVKVGGSLREAPGLMEALVAHPGELVVVHGGGPRISAWLERLGYKTRFTHGLRATPPEQMEVVEMVLAQTGKVLAQLFSRAGRPAISLSGRDAELFLGEVADVELGRVGRISTVNTELLNTLLKAGLTPVLAPVAPDATGALNINADSVAASVAGALYSEVIFLTDVDGVLADPSQPDSLLSGLDAEEARTLIERRVIDGGMVPKVQAALDALSAGAPGARITRGSAESARKALTGQGGTVLRPHTTISPPQSTDEPV